MPRLAIGMNSGNRILHMNKKMANLLSSDYPFNTVTTFFVKSRNDKTFVLFYKIS